jgi:SPP1 gp7 family putative phage head morphogenesis protein
MANKTYVDIIESGNELIEAVIQYHLPKVKEVYEVQIFHSWDFLNEDEKYLATDNLNISPSIMRDFQNDMKQAFAEISNKTIEDAIDEIKLKTITLAEPKNPFRNKPSKLNDIPSSVRKRIEKQSELFTDAIIVDYKKDVMFIYDQNWQLNKKEIGALLDDGYLTFISGKKIENGIESQTSQVVNENRVAVFTSPEALEAGLVFEFFNPNDERTSPLCAFLVGTIFTADDPRFDRYTCPLHINCRSTFLPLLNYQGKIDGLPALKELPPEARAVLQY